MKDSLNSVNTCLKVVDTRRLGVVALLGARVVLADSVTVNPDTSATWIVL
jgi:hypothetical protein